MEITINNQPVTIPDDGLTVQDLLYRELSDKQNGIALAINNTVIPKTEWSNHYITENDHILIISATQGG
ncbi:sulfur carrier protein ThiS [Flavobacterium supellecticarium]|uniref:Sulfur carrier protein ThiS n=1 Tax=Flavobacterium supellecticarium TaxID=2565924 RepID=A0A4S3ZT01_9FLAO|nr:sulfur carrier protein ThiS [Flavobacterium supellecticarium]THF48806.1 sulfur carrier protein ThiS [Flavobacterium supellecticarium]